MNNPRDKYRIWDEEKKEYVSSKVFINHHGECCLICHGGFYPNKTTKEHCTGQKDMKGLLIYENDIVKVYRPMMDSFEKAVVTWAEEESCWVCKWLKPEEVKKDCWHASDSGTYFDGKNCYVIGNIHKMRKEECPTPSTPK